ncbi:MAG: hypothetical protein R3200_12515, partial [Xanthomonadales bacterium]|nr:hypothetical protein [Xanthomonadales bacterium]
MAAIGLGTKRTQQLNREELEQVLAVARGDRPADLLIRNAEVLDLVNGGAHRTHIALCGHTIAGVGNDYEE